MSGYIVWWVIYDSFSHLRTSYFSNFWFRLQTGQVLGDTQSGFRGYPLAVLERLKLREKHYAFEIEVLVKAAWGGIKLDEVNISVYYPP